MKRQLFGMTLPEISAVTDSLGMKPFKAKQIARWLYAKNADAVDAMSDLSLGERAALSEGFEVGRSAPLAVSVSADGTKKYLFDAGEGNTVEAAWIPEEDRSTLCVSSQAGCKMACVFCATGKMGFRKNLPAAGILNQLFSIPERDRVTNIVYMGMGEPLDNVDAVLASLDILTSDWGLAWSPKRVTVSTIGLRDGLRRFLEESSCHLAVSLHSPYSDQRLSLMPVEKTQPFAGTLDLIRQYDWSGQRRVSFEYIMFGGLNDTPGHAKALAALLSGLSCRVNLIGFHAVPGVPFTGSPRTVMEEFRTVLNRAGIRTTIRASRGLDIEAACGLLSTKRLEEA